MDVFNRVKYDESFEYTLKDPSTREDTDVVIYMKSMGSADVRAIDLKILNELRSNQIAGKESSIESDLENTYSKLEACITGWNDKLEDGGSKVEFTPENVKRLVRIDWIFRQLNKFAGDIENFMK